MNGNLNIAPPGTGSRFDGWGALLDAGEFVFNLLELAFEILS